MADETPDKVENGAIHGSGQSNSAADENGEFKNGLIPTENTPLFNLKQKRQMKKINRYYDNQVELLHSYHLDLDHLATSDGQKDNADLETNQRKRDAILAKIVLVLNVALLIVKIAAAALSNSLSVISTVIESGVDFISGVIIWATSSAIRHRDPYEYPIGRTKLEPLAVIFVSIIMGVANIQVIIQAITQIIDNSTEPAVDVLTVSILSVGILSKVVFFFFCLREAKRSSSAKILAQDSRNDVLTNFVALICAFVGTRYWKYADPIGAMVVSTWVAFNWFHTAADQVPLISGKCATPNYINRIIRISAEHDPRIRYLETVLCYHYGNKFLVEVHIVLDGSMPLKDAHDILEGLQKKLESLDFVERAFVHADYEFCHKLSDEHKVR